MATIESARTALEIEVRDNVHETPNPSKNEGWVAATMQAADEYALAVLEEAVERAALYEGCPPGTEPEWAGRFRDQINAPGSQP